MELLERKEFLDELEAIRHDVAAGNGRFVLVSGEAGDPLYQTAVVLRKHRELLPCRE